MLVTWSFPTTIVFGAGALATLPDHVKRIGGSACSSCATQACAKRA